MRVSRAERTANYVILAAFALFAIIPILTILQAALGPSDTAGAGAGTTASFAGLHFGNFAEAWQVGHFGRYMRMSFMVSASVVVVSVGLSILSGFAFGTMRFRGSTALFYLFLLGIMMPTEAIVVPLYFDLRTLGLTDTFWAVALPQVAQSVAFGTFWMRAYFRSSSRSLIEAARLDGASNRRILWQVFVPLARPAIVTLTVLVFNVDLERVPDPAGHGDRRVSSDRTTGTGLLPGSVHPGVHPAGRRCGHRGDACRRSLSRPSASLHRGHAGRRGS